MKHLVEQGVNIRVRNNYALRFGQQDEIFDIVKYLIKREADIYANGQYLWSYENCEISGK